MTRWGRKKLSCGGTGHEVLCTVYPVPHPPLNGKPLIRCNFLNTPYPLDFLDKISKLIFPPHPCQHVTFTPTPPPPHVSECQHLAYPLPPPSFADIIYEQPLITLSNFDSNVGKIIKVHRLNKGILGWRNGSTI